MKLRHTMFSQGDHLLVEVAGDYDYGDLIDALVALRAECERQGMDKAIVDLTGLVGFQKGFDRYYLGRAVAERIGTSVKLAVVGKREDHDEGFGESTAKNHGADLSVFFERRAAMDWLRSS